MGASLYSQLTERSLIAMNIFDVTFAKLIFVNCGSSVPQGVVCATVGWGEYFLPPSLRCPDGSISTHCLKGFR